MRRAIVTKNLLLLGMLSLFVILFSNCSKTNGNNDSSQSCLRQLGTNTEWSSETEIAIDGYAANAMEPKTSEDQVVLFWNDKPPTDDAMNIHYAVRQDNGRYLHIGPLPGTVSDSHLDGVPAIDSAGNFYFVSTRSYASNFQTIYGGQVKVLGPNSLEIINVAAADSSVSFKQLGKVDMDIDISWDGTLMVASRAQFSGNSYPDSSYLELFSVVGRNASTLANSSDLLKNVNLSACTVYAGSLSSDLKEIYYAVFSSGAAPNLSGFRVVVAKRNSISEPFGQGAVISAINGDFTEAPAISFDGKTIFYHKRDPATDRLKIYKIVRP